MKNLYLKVYLWWYETRLCRKLDRIKYWFFHRWHPKHKYNTIVVGPPGYYDPDQQIEDAIIKVFVCFIEHEQNTNLFELLDNPEPAEYYGYSRETLQKIRDTYKLIKSPEFEKLNYEQLTEVLVTIISYRAMLWY
jgi:hypothetical protein